MTNHTHEPAVRRSRTRIPATTAAATAAALAASLLAGCSAGDQEEAKSPAPVASSPHQSKAPAPKSPSPKAPTHAPSTPAPAPGTFAPYVDTSLRPSYDLLKGARETGVKEYNLAFVSPGDGCVPKWGGRQELADNPVARQADRLRSQGGEVRISFGGQSGNELARVCGSVDKLVDAYRKVIDAYHLTKADFDIEGPALTDTKANDLRARAIARLQQGRKLDVSFTLPVIPSGLNRDSLAVLHSAQKNGVRVSAVNIMAMDYGTYYDGDMGKYAIDAATATHRQIKAALGIHSEAAAWKTVGVTPMIGVNDVKGEVFRPDDAAELKAFAEKKGLGRLSMWSLTRDKPCPQGANIKAQATCSSIGKNSNEFVRAFTG
ncbi:glycosyl hydrolase family 18 protein [Streptomyces sp. C184]|uniref:glycosyl hydrolase family 18 protein n=1 Tax=Streptomyces sp. C184 TaxID=3237121 RepID=UPI0034C657FC